MTTKTCGCTTETCGCCEGIQALTPQSTVNRPGLSALSYRVGTHGAFLETMKARLSTMTVDVPGTDGITLETFTPLLDLTTRDSGDFSIALLDGWATVADVLTFYQERIANEGFLRTATERRSILDLARLLGYKLRPGVAATVYLAYTIDENQTTPAQIPAGARSQSIPGPGELPQSFETSDPLEARAIWSTLRPRLTRPQTKKSIQELGRLYLSGIATNLKPNDALLIDFAEAGRAPTAYRVQQLIPDAANNHTQVLLQSWIPSVKETRPDKALPVLGNVLKSLELSPSIPPRNALQLPQSPTTIFAENADVFPRLLTTLRPRLSASLYPVLQNIAVTTPQPIRVYALRVTASLFGANAPRQILQTTPNVVTGEWPVVEAAREVVELRSTAASRVKHENPQVVWLDASYDKIQPNSWLIVETEQTNLTNSNVLVAQARNTNAALSRSDYGLSAKSTRITLAPAPGTTGKAQWITADLETLTPVSGNVPADTADFQAIRRTAVYAQSEELSLAEVPIDDAIDGAEIELDGLVDGLEAGRWLIVTGERNDADLSGTSGVHAAELLMLQGTDNRYDATLPGDKMHTFLRLAKAMAYSYKRNTVTIYGNVVKATHGETRNETLGNGDGSQSLQSFALKQPPLTFVPASNPTGVESTLEVFINNVQWHEAETLARLGPKDRNFITKTDNDDKTTVIFGNGKQGARLPTGMANVTSVYRNGIGRPGNVKAEQISLLQTRPLGVKSVINPLSASGGADRENRDQARENAPLAVMSLDRLVSVVDYADFSRTFAGIGKAAARKLSDTRRQLVHVTIAGADDIPIDATSDLYQNLLIALRKFGDPDLPVQVQLRELVVLVLSANVRLAADYQWEPVATQIRTALLDAFGFQKRALGQAVLLSEIISTIQNTAGVEYVDVDAFGGVPEKIAQPDGTRALLSLDQIATAVQQIVNPRHASILARYARPAESVPATRVDANLADFENGTLRPAQLAVFTDAAPDTLILNQIK
jgi:predicted phage baseplate assembly protein